MHACLCKCHGFKLKVVCALPWMAVDLGAVGALLQQGGSAAVGGWIGTWLRGDRACHCVCEQIGPNNHVLALLEKHLDRCGPEHLAGQDRCSGAWSTSWLIVGVILGFLGGCFFSLYCQYRRWCSYRCEAARDDDDKDSTSSGEAVDRGTAQRHLRALRQA